MLKVLAKNHYFLKKPHYDSSNMLDVSSCQIEKGLTGYYKGGAPPLPRARQWQVRPMLGAAWAAALGYMHCGSTAAWAAAWGGSAAALGGLARPWAAWARPWAAWTAALGAALRSMAWHARRRGRPGMRAAWAARHGMRTAWAAWHAAGLARPRRGQHGMACARPGRPGMQPAWAARPGMRGAWAAWQAAGQGSLAWHARGVGSVACANTARVVF